MALVTLMALAPTRAAAADSKLRRFGANIEIAADGQDNLLAAGAKVAVRGSVAHDASLFGGAMDLDMKTGGSLLAVGGHVSFTGEAAGGLDVYAGRATIGGRVGDDATVTAGSVEVSPDATITGDAHIYAPTATFLGRANGDLTMSGDDITFGGSAGRSVQLVGDSVHILAGASAGGTVTVYSNSEPSIAEGAAIKGKIETHSLKEWDEQRQDGAVGPITRLLRALQEGEAGWAVRGIAAAILGASALVAGLFFLWFGRGSVEQTIDDMLDHPVSNTLYGLGVLIGLPLAAIVLFFTVFGAPIGLLTLLALPLFGLLGYASAGFSVGEWLFNRAGEPVSQGGRVLSLLGGLVVLFALSLIPYAGGLVLMLAVLCGLGTFMRTLHERLRGRAAL